MEEGPLRAVQARELREQPVVDLAVRRLRVEGPVHGHERPDLVRTDAAQGQRRAQRHPAQPAQKGIGDSFDGAVADVGDDLAPELGLRTTSDAAKRVEPARGEVLDGLEPGAWRTLTRNEVGMSSPSRTSTSRTGPRRPAGASTWKPSQFASQ